jgi:Xaa-Pro aminopeptidase
MNRNNLLIVADSETNADMLYAVGMFVPDPFIYLRLGGTCHVVVSDLELSRTRRLAPHCRVLALSRYQKRLRDEGIKKVGFPQVIRAILRERKVKKLFVPETFPLGLAKALRHLGVKIKLCAGPTFPAREFKTADEIKKISAALVMAEVGLAEAVHALRNSKIGSSRRLMYRNAPLTSERLRSIIHTAVFQAGGSPAHTIVAGGRQGCDPHEEGHGVLHAQEPIVIDIFPRSQRTGFFGDITRTVVKGRASEAVRRLYHSVAAAQQLAFDRLRKKVPCAEVHQTVINCFHERGYTTRRRPGGCEGFFHGTGHGVGLEIHEAPRINGSSTDVLAPGHVVTVEPGLYYPEIGGVRLEDVALVTGNGPRNLTKFEKILEL